MTLTHAVPTLSVEIRLLIVLVSAVVHHVVYLGSGILFSRLFKKFRFPYADQRSWRSRCTSMVHAFIVGALGFWVLFIEKKLDMESSETATDLSTITIAISAGYFLWDSIVVLLRYDLFGFLFALHGIYCLYVYAVATFWTAYHYYGIALLMFEWSTPSMNAFFMADQVEVKWDELGKASTSSSATHNNGSKSVTLGAPSWYKKFTFILSAIFALCFFFVRIIWGNYHYYHFYRVVLGQWSLTPAWFNISMMALIVVAFLLNGTWMVQIILTGLNVLPKPGPNAATAAPSAKVDIVAPTALSPPNTGREQRKKRD